MTKIELLEKRQTTISTQINGLADQAEKCTDIAEMRKINENIDLLQSDLEKIEAELSEIRGANVPKGKDVDFRELKKVGGGTSNEDITESTEYRNAFKNLVLRKIPIPAELRANENTLTTDVAAAVPTVLVNQIIERMDECGMILPLLTKNELYGRNSDPDI